MRSVCKRKNALTGCNSNKPTRTRAKDYGIVALVAKRRKFKACKACIWKRNLLIPPRVSACRVWACSDARYEDSLRQSVDMSSSFCIASGITYRLATRACSCAGDKGCIVGYLEQIWEIVNFSAAQVLQNLLRYFFEIVRVLSLYSWHCLVLLSQTLPFCNWRCLVSEVQGLRHCQAKPSTNCTAGRQAARHLKARRFSHLWWPYKASQSLTKKRSEAFTRCCK